MNYVNYDREIQKRYKVQIHKTWPVGVRFVKPSRITKLDEVQDLHDALEKGTTYWAKLTEAELAELSERLQGTGVPARIRSDKGGKHKKGKRTVTREDSDSDSSRDGEGEKAPARKRARNSRAHVNKLLPPSVKSVEFVEESDDEDDSDQ